MNTFEIVLTVIALLAVLVTFIQLKRHVNKIQHIIDEADKRTKKVLQKVGML